MARLKPQIERALEHGGNTHSFDDLVVAIDGGRFALFWEEDAILIVDIVTFPQCRIAVLFIGAGRLASVVKLVERATDFARELGCKQVTMHGRKGWARVLNKLGWKVEPLLTMARELFS